jgi:GNAT superfamily N-acetyltransferase
LQVTQKDIAKLQALHPATLSEYNEGNGPCIWILLIPTTRVIMNQFLQGQISENGILQQTKPGTKFEAVYLCSATTLPEYRGKGLTSKLAIEAINNIRAENPVTALFVWPFTKEGEVLAQKIADRLRLPLRIKKH